MYESHAHIAALLGVASETHDLEFKRGDALDKIDQPSFRAEIVRDVIAFANAGGGTIIYGIEEDRSHTTALAKSIWPVSNGNVTDLKLAQIIRTGVEPVFSQFNVKCIDEHGGRIIVITVDQADTAHQCKHDLKYYHRVGTQVQPMHDYEIRDVMNRRKAPHVVASLEHNATEMRAERHIYLFSPVLSNTGTLTAHHWALELIVPDIVKKSAQTPALVITRDRLKELRTHEVFEFSSDRQPHQRQSVLLPGQCFKLNQQNGYPKIAVSVEDESWQRLQQGSGDIRLRLYVDDCRMVETVISFQEWCKF